MNTKRFWKTYLTDKPYLVFKAVFLILILALVIGVSAIAGHASILRVLPFALCYWASDPFCYYLLVYKTKLRREAQFKDLQELQNQITRRLEQQRVDFDRLKNITPK